MLKNLIRLVTIAFLTIYASYNVYVIYIENNPAHIFNRVYEVSAFFSNYFIFQLIYFIFFKQMRSIAVLICAALAFCTSEIMFFEEMLPHSLHQYIEFSNARTPKITFALALFVVTLILWLFKKNRSFDRFFALTQFSVIILTTFLYHKILIDGVLFDIHQSYLDKIQQHQLDTKTLSISNNIKEDSLNEFEKNLITIFKKQPPGYNINLDVYNGPDDMVNFVYIIEKNKNNEGYIEYENTTFNKSKKTMINRYYQVHILPQFFWFFFGLIMMVIHKNPAYFRKKMSLIS